MSKAAWNPDNIKDVAESVGITTLNDEVLHRMSQDVEYRLAQVLEEALKFMRHGQRSTLSTQDISQALKVLDVEPLYGYESTRPLRFGEASIGPGQPLFYVEDEEVDFEKLINQPLPKVPREISFTAHWLAVEGVQPSIPQNPTTAEVRSQELLPKGPGANPHLSAISGNDSVTVKPLVKHILSKELQLYFEKVCAAILDESNDEYRAAALSSLRNDPGLQQLVPYFVQFLAEKVTHSLNNNFVLTQMMHLISAILENPTLYFDPYISPLIAPILTTLLSRRLGAPSSTSSASQYALRDLSSSLLASLVHKYSSSSTTLKPRLLRALLRDFLNPTKSFATHYGAITALAEVGGSDVVAALVVPNLKLYGESVSQEIEEGEQREDAEMAASAVVKALGTMVLGASGREGKETSEDNRKALAEKIGDFFAHRIITTGKKGVVDAVLSSQG